MGRRIDVAQGGLKFFHSTALQPVATVRMVMEFVMCVLVALPTRA